MNSLNVRRHLAVLAPLLIVTAATRLLWLAFVHPDPNDGRFDDTVWYRLSGSMVALGHGYANPYSGTPTVLWPPGYPAFLGAVFKAFGEGLAQTYLANVVLAMITVAIVYVIGLRLFERRVAVLGAAAVAIWPGQVFFASLTLSEVLFTALFALAVMLVVLVPDAARSRGALVIAFGIVATAAAFTRGQALVLLLLAPLAWGLAGMQWRRAIAWGMLAGAVAGILIAPWVVRNERELHSPVIIAANVGGNLWLGNHDGSTGHMQTDQPLPLPSREGLTQQEYEVKGDRMALREALSYITHHPLAEIPLAGAKLRATYESDATGLDWNSAYDNSFYPGSTGDWLRGLANGFWFTALVLAGVGLLTERSRLTGRLAVLPLVILLWTGVHLVFFGDSRFHYPIVFAFALLAARGAVVLYEAVWRRQPSLGRRYAAA